MTSVSLKWYPQNAIPESQRAAWIEQHGVPPREATTEVTAPLTTWGAAGATILPDGSVTDIDRTRPYGDSPGWTLQQHLRTILRQTGEVLTSLDATEILREVARANGEARRERALHHLERLRDGAYNAWADLSHVVSSLTPEEQAEAERLHAEQEAAAEAAKDRARAEEAAKKRAADAAAAELRQFALEGHAGPAALRAAGDGYDVRAAVLDAVQEQLPRPDAVSKPGDEYAWEERSSPKADAFALLDRIAESAKAVTLKPACLEVDVSRVLRITEPDSDDGQGRKRTGVVVTLSSPATQDRYLIYFVEA